MAAWGLIAALLVAAANPSGADDAPVTPPATQLAAPPAIPPIVPAAAPSAAAEPTVPAAPPLAPASVAPVPAAPVDPALPSIAVVGVTCATKDRDWRDGLVGFGIENWVAQAFYDSGRYRLVEERPEVLAAAQNSASATFDAVAANRGGDLRLQAQALGVDLVAVGRVTAMFSRTQGFTFGPVHNQSRQTYVRLELCLYDARDGRTVKTEAQGSVGRSSAAFGADFGANKIPFDPATVGPATGSAVEGAVAKLVPGYRPRHREVGPVTLGAPLVLGVLPLGLAPEVGAAYPELKRKRVGLGLHSRIVKTISATPNCGLLEINPEVIDSLQLQWYMGNTGAPGPDEVSARSQLSARPDWIIYGQVFSFAVSKLEKLSGLSGKVNSQVTIGVQLRAIDPGANPPRYYVASGTGKASGDWEAWRGDDADMEQSWVGRAAGAAIDAAWPALLHDLATAPASAPGAAHSPVPSPTVNTAAPAVAAVAAG